FLEELLSDDSIPLPENESSNFDHHDDLSFPRPPSESSDVEFLFDFEPNSGEVISTTMNNIDELYEDECFNLGEEEIRLVENLLYDNSSPRPSKELNAEIADTIVKTLSISYPR
nr:hypothetical protein [Tanacetum cinerariifolium]